MKKKILAVFSVLFLCSSCSKDDIRIDPENLLIRKIQTYFQEILNSLIIIVTDLIVMEL